MFLDDSYGYEGPPAPTHHQAQTTPLSEVESGDLGNVQLSRKVTLPNGYQYRQFSDGRIVVMAEPGWTGRYLSATMNPTKWSSVTQQIGTWQANVGQPLREAAVQGVQQLAQAIGGKQKRKFQPSAASAEPIVEPSTTESSGVAWSKVALYGGLGLGGLVLTIIVIKAIRSNGKSE